MSDEKEDKEEEAAPVADPPAPMLILYGEKHYWDRRYRKYGPDVAHEWFIEYKQLSKMFKPIYFSTTMSTNKGPFWRPLAFNPHVAPLYFPSKKNTRTLLLGCGNSPFGEEMVSDGWTGGMTQLDFSSVVIKQMQERYKDHPNSSLMNFVEADMTERLPFEDESFDLVIVKASLDTIMTGPTTKFGARRAVREAARVLANGHGIFFLVTTGNIEDRLEILEYEGHLDYFWQGVCEHTLSRPSKRNLSACHAKTHCHVYICRKQPALPTQVHPEKENATPSATVTAPKTI